MFSGGEGTPWTTTAVAGRGNGTKMSNIIKTNTKQREEKEKESERKEEEGTADVEMKEPLLISSEEEEHLPRIRTRSKKGSVNSSASGSSTKGSFFIKPGPSSSKKKGSQTKRVGEVIDPDSVQEIEDSSDEGFLPRPASRLRQGPSRSEEGSDLSDSDRSPPGKKSAVDTSSQISGSSRKRERTKEKQDSRTTGAYVGRREAVAALNLEKKETIRLDKEMRIGRLGTEELWGEVFRRKNRIDPEKLKEEAELLTNDEITERALLQMSEVIRVAISSANLKGTFQKSLKMAAAISMGCIEVLKERAAMTPEEAHREETRKMRKEIADLRMRLEEEVEDERRKALAAASEMEAYRTEVQILRNEKAQRKGRKSESPKETIPKDKIRDSPKKAVRKAAEARLQARATGPQSESEAMEGDVTSQTMILDPPEEWQPVRAPPLRGKRKLIKEDVKERERIYQEHRRYIRDRKPISEQEKEELPKDSKGQEDGNLYPPTATPRALADMMRESVIQVLVDYKVIQDPARKRKEKEALAKKGTSKVTLGKQTPRVSREKPMITSIVEIKPRLATGPSTSATEERESWSKVVGRRQAKRVKETAVTTPGRSGRAPPGNVPKLSSSRRPPRSAAIQISCRGEMTYAGAMRIAREKVNIDDLGITDIRPRRTRTGAMLLEIPGVNGAAKANSLAVKLKEALGDQEDVMISRPEKQAEIRVRDIDDSTTIEEIVTKVASMGDCDPANVKPGNIIQSFNGLGTLWVRCPLTAAKLITANRRMRVGWNSVRVDLLPERSVQCFKCLETGHVRAQCKSDIDRSSLCYRCGRPGHGAKGCLEPAHCCICADKGLSADHRMGGMACNPNQNRRTAVKGTPAGPRKLIEKRDEPRRDPEMEVVPDTPGMISAAQGEGSQSRSSRRSGSVTRSMAACSLGNKGSEPVPMEVEPTKDDTHDTETPEESDSQEKEWPPVGLSWTKTDKPAEEVGAQELSKKEGVEPSNVKAPTSKH